MKKRYLNMQYPNPRDASASVLGSELWLKATVQRGTRAAPPTGTWIVRRDAQQDDGFFVADPAIAPQAHAADATEWWARVTLAEVTGAAYAVELVRHKAGKADKVFAVQEKFQTWRRVYFDVRADTAALYTQFTAALPRVKAALAEACYEVVENRVWVGDEARKSVDASTKAGRSQGKLMTVELHEPKRTNHAIRVKTTIHAGAVNCGQLEVVGNTLTITLGGGRTWDVQQPLRKLIAERDAQTLVEVKPYEGGRLDGTGGLQPRGFEALALIGARTSDTVLTLQLDAAPMANRWNVDAWNAPRGESVVQAMELGDVKLDMEVSFDVTGMVAASCSPDNTTIETFVVGRPEYLAAVICHEFGHAYGLVRTASTRKYDVQKHAYSSADAARPALAVVLNNDRYYNSSFGGKGTHCSQGALREHSCFTSAGETYSHQGPDPLCVMYHGKLSGAGDVLLTDGVRFCPVCISQLRGR